MVSNVRHPYASSVLLVRNQSSLFCTSVCPHLTVPLFQVCVSQHDINWFHLVSFTRNLWHFFKQHCKNVSSVPTVWEPISATLHKITTQCDPAATWYILHQGLFYQAIHKCYCATQKTACPLCATPQHILHIHSIWAIYCLRLATYGQPLCTLSKGAWSLRRSFHNITFWEK